jgi:hypothetical protein
MAIKEVMTVRMFRLLSNDFRDEIVRFLVAGIALSIAGIVCMAQTPRAVSEQPGTLFPLCRAAKMCGYVDPAGKVIVSQIYAYTSRFSEGRGRMESANRKFGFLDTSGKVVIPLKYDDAGDFHEGLARVTVGGKSGFIDETGAWVIRPTISQGPRALPSGVDDFSDGVAFISELNGRQGWIDRSGSLVLNAPTEDRDHWISASGGFGNDLIVLMLSPKPGAAGNAYGYMNKAGKIVIPPRYNNATAFSHGLAGVESREAQNPKWGYIDTTGKTVVDFRFTFADSFSEELAAVGLSDKCGYIDRKGEVVVEPKYDTCGGFSEGLASIRQGSKWGYIDKLGRVVVAPQFRAASGFVGGLATVELDVGYAYVGRDGKVIARSRTEIPPF